MTSANRASGPASLTTEAYDVVGDAPIHLEDVVDRDALTEVCKSIHALFGIGVRVYSHDGALLGGAAAELEPCTFVNEIAAGRVACASTVSAAKSVDPGDAGDVIHACFTGLAYRIVSLDYETRRVGRIVLGPYAPAGLRDAPADLERSVPKLDVVQANELLAKLPRVKPETLARIAGHLKTTLELIIFSSHKAYVTSKLHLYSVRQSYRDLEEKTERLEQALAKLKEADRLKSNFLATVSHELRTPLTSIIGYSEMLAEGIAGALSDEQSEFVRTIHAKGGQLLGLITGLLDLSKLDSGTMTLRQTDTKIGPIVSDVVKTLTPAAKKKGVVLVLDDEAADTEISGDPERLRQVFVNLVDNAVKFTPPSGTVTLRARVVERAGDDDDDGGAAAVLFAPLLRHVEVRVIDSGIGIPAPERAKVFDAFYQVDSSSTREFGGTGLGLSIVKRIVQAHGGQVSIEGNEPQGTVFVVTLPSAQARRVLPSRVPPAST
jgi:signal transduction histidine kinase